MKPAIIIVDMLEGNYGKERNADREEEKIVPAGERFPETMPQSFNTGYIRLRQFHGK